MDHLLVLPRPPVAHDPIAECVRIDSVDLATETGNPTTENIMEVQEPTEQRDSEETLSPLEQHLTSTGPARDDLERKLSRANEREAVLPARARRWMNNHLYFSRSRVDNS